MMNWIANMVIAFTGTYPRDSETRESTVRSIHQVQTETVRIIFEEVRPSATT